LHQGGRKFAATVNVHIEKRLRRIVVLPNPDYAHPCKGYRFSLIVLAGINWHNSDRSNKVLGSRRTAAEPPHGGVTSRDGGVSVFGASKQ
jgi:hypothetical protein